MIHMSTELRTTFEGRVDGVKVVSAYRAFAEHDKPYCISADLGDEVLYATFQPTVEDEYFDADEAAAFNFRQVTEWVAGLTTLIEKARAWDSFVDEVDTAALEDLEDEIDLLSVPLTSVVYAAVSDGPESVDELLQEHTDRVWLDREGDHFKVIDGQWHIWFGPDDPNEWTPVVSAPLLKNFGPYTHLVPRQVNKLTEDTRDAEWNYTSSDGQVHHYRWDNEAAQWEAWGHRTLHWVLIGAEGPFLPDPSARLIEVI